MALPIRPPVSPMLAKLAREVPEGGYLYEPKWDGFRALAFRDGGQGSGVEIWSRHDRPLGRYFPELIEAFASVEADGFVVDGEIVPLPRGSGPDGHEFDFAALMGRLHPAASRVERLRHEAPAAFVAFDLLAEGSEDLTTKPFRERRACLERTLGGAASPLFVTPITRDVGIAGDWLERLGGAGIDGIVAKHEDLRYEPGRRAMVKVKRERAADCVLAGVRLFGDRPIVSSLILGLYDGELRLHHVGVVTQLPTETRQALINELAPLVTPLERHPWRDGFLIGRSPLGRLKGSAARWTPEMEHDWVPLRPERVVEVGFDQVDGDRFRHPARFRRWRPDRTAESCRLEQILVVPVGLEAVLGAGVAVP